MHPEIDFYLLTESSSLQEHRLCCRLIDKAYQQGKTVWVATQDAEESSQLDQLLWTFSETSFIPHHIAGEATPLPPPIVISHDKVPEGSFDILINRQHGVPEFFHLFSRILEVVPRSIARDHYRYYQQHQCDIRSHELKNV